MVGLWDGGARAAAPRSEDSRTATTLPWLRSHANLRTYAALASATACFCATPRLVYYLAGLFRNHAAFRFMSISSLACNRFLNLTQSSWARVGL